MKEKKPNIIFLLADDLRDNMFGIMGHSQVKTPNFDKLISQSVRFSNTYIAEPVCAPSRVSLFTGMPERIHGVGFSSSYQLTEAQWDKTYPALLQKNGYYTGFIGKFGVEYYSFRGKAAGKFDYWYGHDGWTKFFPKDYDNFSCNPYHQAKHDIITPIMGEAMNDFLNSAVDKGPFCLSVSFNVPHGSQATSMYADYPEWHEMIRPANENPKLKGHPIYDALYRNTDLNIPEEVGTDPYRFIPQSILDQDKGRRNQTYTYAYHPETSQEHHVRYFQLITGLDEVIGQLMDELKQRSLLDNTIIIFGSDHGLLMGEYGMGGKALLYDLTAKIPCFIYDPRIPENERGKTLDQLVSSLDIPVTILDYAGINPPAEMSGSSLIPLIKGEQTQWRDELFLESLFTLRDNPFCEGIRKGPWKYVRMFDGVAHYTEKDLDFRGKEPDFEQLFNLNDDPEEKFNLAAEYNNSKLLNELRGKVKKYAAEVNRQRKAYLKTHQISVR
ncbi:MAG: sulfatase-like hydrolase/transferase [Candidatus Cyclobacteriaceae bacterium M3_2C_046]